MQSETAGLLEVIVALGDPVQKGQTLALVHDVTRTGLKPVSYHSPISGIFAGRHASGLIALGDMVAVIAVEV